jgi:hypothetical protein
MIWTRYFTICGIVDFESHAWMKQFLAGKNLLTFVAQVLDILKETGYTEDRFFIHCDGALFGMMMPFLKDAPMVTFKKPIGSVSVSGHKFVGAPVPWWV